MDVRCVRAFTKDGTGGNFAGVVILSEEASEQSMQSVAKQVGYSETVFVHAAHNTLYLRYFTPEGEVDLCGHATIAALFILKPSASTQIQTKAGEFHVFFEGDRAFMEQTAPRFGDQFSKREIAKVLGIPVSYICNDPQIVSTGLRDLFIQFDTRAQLDALHIDDVAIARFSEQVDVVGIHAFTLDTLNPGATAYARNFAPRYGIHEESATGTSTVALTQLLRQRKLISPQDTYVFEQGYTMGSPSEIRIRDIGGVLYVGGSAVVDRCIKVLP